jgi:hypothetical protein
MIYIIPSLTQLLTCSLLRSCKLADTHVLIKVPKTDPIEGSLVHTLLVQRLTASATIPSILSEKFCYIAIVRLTISM